MARLWHAEGASGLRQRADALRQPALLPGRLTDSEQQQGSPAYRQFGPLSDSSLVGRADEPRSRSDRPARDGLTPLLAGDWNGVASEHFRSRQWTPITAMQSPAMSGSPT